MKTLAILSAIALSLLIASCTNNKDMLTVINADGSCSRSFTTTVDSAFMVGDTAKSNPFPVELDGSWKISWQYDTLMNQTRWPLKSWKWNTSDKVKTITGFIRRDYKSVEDMNENFRLKNSHNWSKMRAKYSLKKEFRWFYTYYTYKEDYPKLKTFDRVPFEKYMTKEEAGFWFTGKPDLLKGMNGLETREYVGGIENKYNLWFSENLWIIEYEELLKQYDSLPDKPVSRERLELARDSVFDKYFPSGDQDKQETDMENSLNGYFKTTKFSPLWNKDTGPMKKFKDNGYDLDFVNLFTEAFNYKLIMPGKVIRPENAIVHGDTLIWKLDAYRMVPENYEITATSRKANVWAFIVSALVVILAAASYFYKIKK